MFPLFSFMWNYLTNLNLSNCFYNDYNEYKVDSNSGRIKNFQNLNSHGQLASL